MQLIFDSCELGMKSRSRDRQVRRNKARTKPNKFIPKTPRQLLTEKWRVQGHLLAAVTTREAEVVTDDVGTRMMTVTDLILGNGGEEAVVIVGDVNVTIDTTTDIK